MCVIKNDVRTTGEKRFAYRVDVVCIKAGNTWRITNVFQPPSAVVLRDRIFDFIVDRGECEWEDNCGACESESGEKREKAFSRRRVNCKVGVSLAFLSRRSRLTDA